MFTGCTHISWGRCEIIFDSMIVCRENCSTTTICGWMFCLWGVIIEDGVLIRSRRLWRFTPSGLVNFFFLHDMCMRATDFDLFTPHEKFKAPDMRSHLCVCEPELRHAHTLYHPPLGGDMHKGRDSNIWKREEGLRQNDKQRLIHNLHRYISTWMHRRTMEWIMKETHKEEKHMSHILSEWFDMIYDIVAGEGSTTLDLPLSISIPPSS